MDNLDKLLDEPGIWRAGGRQLKTGLEHVATGFPTLDAVLPGDGWPLGALTEVLHAHTGIGELSLFMPALAELSRRDRWVALIAPPYLPYAPALAGHGVNLSRLLLIRRPSNTTDALWAVEQTLRSGTCAAVLAWPRRADLKSLRRLQLAAKAGCSLGLVFRAHARAKSSPAALRLHLEHRQGQALIKLLKCRGARAGQELTLDLPRSEPLGEKSVAAERAQHSARSSPPHQSDKRPPPQAHLQWVSALPHPRRR